MAGHFCSGIHHNIHHQRVFGSVGVAFARRQGHQCIHTLRLSVDFDESHLVQRHRAMDFQRAYKEHFPGENATREKLNARRLKLDEGEMQSRESKITCFRRELKSMSMAVCNRVKN